MRKKNSQNKCLFNLNAPLTLLRPWQAIMSPTTSYGTVCEQYNNMGGWQHSYVIDVSFWSVSLLRVVGRFATGDLSIYNTIYRYTINTAVIIFFLQAILYVEGTLTITHDVIRKFRVDKHFAVYIVSKIWVDHGAPGVCFDYDKDDNVSWR